MYPVLRISIGLVKPLHQTPFLSRLFSLSPALQPSKERYAQLRSRGPEAFLQYRQQENQRKAARYQNDPVFRKRRSEIQQQHYADALKHDERHLIRNKMSLWLRRHGWIRTDLPWKSHRPVFYDKRIEHYCTGCAAIKSGGRKLWWQDMDDQSFLCHNCYIPPNPDRSKIMPKGYEDVVTFKDLIARKQQLDGVGAPPRQ